MQYQYTLNGPDRWQSALLETHNVVYQAAVGGFIRY